MQTYLSGQSTPSIVMAQSTARHEPAASRRRLPSSAALACLALWTLGIVLAAIQSWLWRFTLSNDTVSYLDMGDYFFHGHPEAIVNGLWSPLYAFLLGATVTLFRTSIYSEYPAVHVLLFLIFVLALGCFEFLLRQLQLVRVRFAGNGSVAEADWAWIVIAHVIFLWASLERIRVSETNPDMLLAAFFYLACGLLARIASGRGSWATFAALGLALGLGYLTKAAMLPLTFILVATAFAISRRQRAKVLVSTCVFLLIAAPYVIALSIQKGRFTVGESGKYNYAVHVNGIPRHHWQGENPSTGTPLHPTRKIWDSPAVYEFKTPIPGTYPQWYDPSYWYDGITPKFHWRQMFFTLRYNLRAEVASLLGALDGVLPLALLLLFSVARRKRQIAGNLSRLLFLVVPAILGLGLYACVHYEERYAGGFYTVGFCCLFFAVLWENEPRTGVLNRGIALLLTLMLVFTSRSFASPPRQVFGISDFPQTVAEDIANMGLRPGDQIASLNFVNLSIVHWARLDRLKIIEEIYYWPNSGEGTTSFWKADRATQEQVLKLFKASGARALISSDAPSGLDASQWSRVGDTDYYLLWLSKVTESGEIER